MITYLYWLLVLGTALAVLALLGLRLGQAKMGMIGAAVVLLIGWGAYYFHFQNIFVKHYGGVMSIRVPEGQRHIIATWKDDHLWTENYDPATNTCIFSEYAKGNMLEGKVYIKDCNPLQAK